MQVLAVGIVYGFPSMCAEAAFSLVALPKAVQAGGVYSPAAACGEGLLERLLATGTTLEVTRQRKWPP